MIREVARSQTHALEANKNNKSTSPDKTTKEAEAANANTTTMSLLRRETAKKSTPRSSPKKPALLLSLRKSRKPC